jgi:hypothetical protein
MTTDTTAAQHTPGPWGWIADLEGQRLELWPSAAHADAPIVTVEGQLIGSVPTDRRISA